MFTAKSPDKLISDAKRRIAVSTERAAGDFKMQLVGVPTGVAK